MKPLFQSKAGFIGHMNKNKWVNETSVTTTLFAVESTNRRSRCC
jgi:hypothetical protein